MIWLLPLAAVLGLASYLGFKAVMSETGETAVTLDAGLPASDTAAVVNAIGVGTDPAQLLALAQKYSAYPYTSYELALRAWELNGKSGPAPTPPTGPGVATAPGLPAAPPGAPTTQTVEIPAGQGQPETGLVGDLQALAAQAAAAAAGLLGDTTPPTPTTATDPTGAVFEGNAASIGSGPGWTAMAVAADAQFTWSQDAQIPADVASEIQRLSSANLTGTLIEQAPDGTFWKFNGAGGVVIASLGSVATAVPPTPEPPQPIPVDPHPTHPGSHGPGMSPPVLPPVHTPPGPGMPPPTPPATQSAGVSPEDAALAAPQAGRRTGGPFVRVRPGDRVWPRRIAEIGTGLRRGAPGSLAHLIDINEHLAPGGVIREFTAGDEINIPPSWVPALKSKGFQIEMDNRPRGEEEE